MPTPAEILTDIQYKLFRAGLYANDTRNWLTYAYGQWSDGNYTQAGFWTAKATESLSWATDLTVGAIGLLAELITPIDPETVYQLWMEYANKEELAGQ